MESKKIKRGLIFVTVLTFVLIVSLCGCSSEYQTYIETVQNGYLGGCLDVTISEMLSCSLPDGKWDAGETNEGEIIVGYKGKEVGVETDIQFKFVDENNFKVSGLGVGDKDIQNNSEAAQVLEGYYTRYYGMKNPNIAAVEMMPSEDNKNLLNGMSASLADKARNPIEISDYFNKDIEVIKNALGITDFDGMLYAGNGFDISYNDENSRVDMVYVRDARFVSLFGINTFVDVETAKERIADRFEFIEERDNGNSTVTLMFIRNNCEDSLSIKYNTDTSLISEISYIFNGLEGYRSEQELKNQKNIFSSECDEIEWYTTSYLNTATTQYELNNQSGIIYEKWDALLNKIYLYLKEILSESEFKELEEDELNWIYEKEAAINEAGELMKGGTGEILERNSVGIEYTKGRVYYLISLIDKKM